MIEDKLKQIKYSRLNKTEHLLIGLFDGMVIDEKKSTTEYIYWKIGNITCFKYVYGDNQLRVSSNIRKFFIDEIKFVPIDNYKQTIKEMFESYVFENKYVINNILFVHFPDND
jgi:hypothetical protein